MLVIRLVHLKDMPSYEDLVSSMSKSNFSQSEESANIGNEIKNKEKFLNNDNQVKKISKDQIKNTIQTKPKLTNLSSDELSAKSNLEIISSFEDLIKLSSKKKEIELKYELERNVSLIKFTEGKIDIGFNENLRKNFVRDLSERLLEWTGKRWVITLTKSEAQKTYSELQSLKKNELLEKEKSGDTYKKFKNIFSDAELIEVSKKD